MVPSQYPNINIIGWTNGLIPQSSEGFLIFSYFPDNIHYQSDANL